MGTALTPALPIRGLILPPESLHIILPKSTPPAVLTLNATSPRQMIRIVLGVRNVSAVAVAPTVTPRNIVIIFISSFCAAFEILSTTPLSLKRLPSISIPTRGAASGTRRTTTSVTTMGKIIFSFCVTGRSCSIVIIRSSLVVRALIIGG